MTPIVKATVDETRARTMSRAEYHAAARTARMLTKVLNKTLGPSILREIEARAIKLLIYGTTHP